MAAVLLLASFAGLACGEGRPPSGPPTAAATTVQKRCGSCHERPSPGLRTRDAVALVVARHRKRLRLDEDQWQAVLDYLAAPSGATTPALDR